MAHRTSIRSVNPAHTPQARWQRRRLVIRVAFFLIFFIGTALAMLSLAN